MSQNTTLLFSIKFKYIFLLNYWSEVPGLIVTQAFRCGFCPHEFFVGTPASSHNAKTCQLGKMKTVRRCEFAYSCKCLLSLYVSPVMK